MKDSDVKATPLVFAPSSPKRNRRLPLPPNRRIGKTTMMKMILLSVLVSYSLIPLPTCQALLVVAPPNSIPLRAMIPSCQISSERTRRTSRLRIFLSSNNNNNNNNNDPAPAAPAEREDVDSISFRIENCQYADLNVVSDIIMDSFYEEKVGWRRLIKLAELNRLQQNFPYVDTDLHIMLVAVLTMTTSRSSSSSSSDTEETPRPRPPTATTQKRTVIGFVDVDARPCKPEIKLPRPYLSDLAVDPKYRRRGIAQALIGRCEEFVRNIPRPELYIRVEETNEAALEMYINKLNYESHGVEVTTDNKFVMTLHKSFESSSDKVVDVRLDESSSSSSKDDEPEFTI